MKEQDLVFHCSAPPYGKIPQKIMGCISVDSIQKEILASNHCLGRT